MQSFEPLRTPGGAEAEPFEIGHEPGVTATFDETWGLLIALAWLASLGAIAAVHFHRLAVPKG